MSGALQQLFGKHWQSLQPPIAPKPADSAACKEAVTALQRCLKSGTAQLVGGAAADLHLCGCDADIVVLLPGLTGANHADKLAAVAAAVQGPVGLKEGFSSVLQGEFSVQCSKKGINVDILVASEQSAGPLIFLDSNLTYKQRQCLSASTAVATAAFLSYQAPLFKAAVRLVKHWAKQLHGQDWNDTLRNRPKSYLLVLLTLKAYQQYIAAAAGSSSSSAAASSAAATAASAAGGSTHDEAAALGCILQNFLRLAAQLSSSTLISWELQYDHDTVQQLLARPDLAAALRPTGCEGHPIVLDPACPTNNVAAAVADISRLKQLAAADLSKVEGSMIAQLEQQLRQMRQEQQNTVLKMQQEQNAVVLQQAKQLAALSLHQCLLGFSSSQVFNWGVSMPVSNWQPGSAEQVVSGPFHWDKGVPDLWLQLLNKPYSATAYGSDFLAGFEVQLAVGKTEEMASLSELKLPIPITFLASSMLTLEASKDNSYYGTYERTCRLDADVSGSLSGSAGMPVVFKRSHLSQLDLMRSYAGDNGYDVQQLEKSKSRTVKFSLVFKLSRP